MPPSPLLAAGALFAAAPLAAQPPAADTVTVTVTVRHDARPVEGAVVRAPGTAAAAQTDALGTAALRLPAGARVVVTERVGLRPDTLRLALRAGRDTAVVVDLAEGEAEEVEAVVVTATRGERRVEDTPVRVEVIDEEEIAEKVAMTPGDVAMMLNETSGLRVQTTSPSLGGANVRVQGLRGRYTLLLADGLPLHGAQAGGLGLLQIPPVDLGRVEIIKGAASALYGGSALGGVVNLVSRRPGREAERTALVNATSRGGADAVFFGAGPLGREEPGADGASARARWGYTLLAGAHRQRPNDVDADGWTDLPGYDRAVVRPRLFFDGGAGRTAFVTAGVTAEDRRGGTPDGRALPGGTPFVEALRTRRADAGALARWVMPDSGALRGAILTVRGSAVEQRHGHRFGDVREHDRHRTAFGEAALAVPRGPLTWVAGAAFQHDAYRAADVAGFDYDFSAPAAFAQLDVDPAPWLALSTSARLDAHSEYGTSVSPRVSLLLRRPAEGALAGWTTRLSAGTGTAAPTPFVEETEATGLTPVLPLVGLVSERAAGASLDVGGPVATAVGRLQLNATAFGSRVRRPLVVREVAPAAGSAGTAVTRLSLANAERPTVTWGADAFARLRVEDVLTGDLSFVGTYVYLRSTEEDPSSRAGRREVPLTPRHSAGFDAMWEREGEGRVGLELYYTGRQSLEDDPYRTTSRPYLLLGLLAEWRLPGDARRARLFVNAEDLTDVRQTRYAPLVRPTRGPGGRWTTDAWTELAGRTINAGVRLAF